jgi:8-oxo-dGTP pyrophosphatase MutT (NUDIX family)
MESNIINTLLQGYLEQFPSESSRLKVFADYLLMDQDSVFHRKNFDGHITASAFVVNATFTHLLLIKHKALGRWLQPGGHVDVADADLVQAAIREAAEETGILATELLYKPVDEQQPLVPFDIDPHQIPDNQKKQEPSHYHHDHRYVFVYQGSGDMQHNQSETEGLMWVPLQDMETDATFGGVVEKLRKVFLNRN